MLWIKPFIHWGFLFIQLVTAVLALRCWNNSRSIVWRYFIVIWVLTFLVEFTGKMMGSFGLNNIWLYNLFDIFFYSGIIFLFTKVFENLILKRLIFFCAVTMIVWSLANILFYDNSVLNTIYTILVSAVIIFLSLAYLIKLFLDSNIITPLKNDFYYWFSVGFIIYFVFNAVMLGMYTEIIESKVAWLPLFIFYSSHLITLVLHIFLWMGFRAAFLWMK